MTSLVPVILCGGAGSRLWPLSREATPKPFMKLADGETLLQKTYARALQLGDVAGLVTVTHQDYQFLVQTEVKKLDEVKAHPVLLEPVSRNTAAAIAMAAFYVADTFGPEAVMLVMPSDHMIEQGQVFAAAVEAALPLCAQGQLVTFGVVPERPETGFGYIQQGEKIAGSRGYKVQQFVEKPDLATAQQYLASGDYLWNTGIFAWRAQDILAALKMHTPKLYDAAAACWQKTARGEVMKFDGAAFKDIPNISIDYAVMERAGNVATIPAHFAWNDIGSWSSLGDLTEADAQGNRVQGEVLLHDVEDSYIHSTQRLVAAIGLKNIVIAETPDAILVADKSRSQDVKHVYQKLKDAGHEAHRFHTTVHRPWGTFTNLAEASGFKVKRIMVNPGAALSLQMHHKRSEHWVVVSGTAKVINGDKTLLLGPNESTFIPVEHKHSLENPGEEPLVLIEVQIGTYLGEDDIVRFSDRYGRA